MVIHPLFVHFPIALLLVGSAGLLWQIWATSRGKPLSPALEHFIDGALGLGYAGLVLTIATGLFDMQNSPKDNARDGWLFFAVLHIIAGVSLMVVYGLLLFRRFVTFQSESKPAGLVASLDKITLVLAIFGLVLLVAAGLLGGHIVYQYRVGVG